MRVISYKDNDPKGWMGDPKRGAALGRRDRVGDASYSGVLLLQHVPLDEGGYDPNYTYYGVGDQLYWAVSTDEGASIDTVFRAKNLEDAAWQMGGGYPNAQLVFLEPMPRHLEDAEDEDGC